MNIKEQKQDRLLFMSVIALISFGLFMLFSASWVKSLEITGGESRTYFLVSQMIKLIPAFFIFIFFTKINYRKLQLISPYLLFISFLLLVYTQFQGCNGDSCRWLSIGPISFQTSDIARFSVILFLASYIDNNYKYMKQFVKGIFYPLLAILPIAFMIIIQPDNSTTLILLIIAYAMLFVGGASFIQLLTIGVLSVGSMGIFILNEKNYALGRILSFMDPTSSASIGYQSNQALIGLKQGGLSGMGIGESIQKYSYLPETHTDFIFAIIGEELGFVAGSLLMLVYYIIFYRAVQISKRSNDIFGIMLSIGFGLSITIYAFINIGVVIGLVPVTGVPLPFISYGGSSLITNLMMIAILLNISKAQRKLNVKRWRLRVNV
jgi:cell division protein FtsW|tara:strand:+ start:1215 stop:2348 length:1134 start_codon:yes stop_codon:yes gene_type:complete